MSCGVAPPSPATVPRHRARVRGVVQGVGFRPFVWHLARHHGLSGWVRNDDQGLVLEVEGTAWAEFLSDLRGQAPALARIDTIDVHPVPAQHSRGFAIEASHAGGAAATMIGPDHDVCPDCLAELFDPADRRHRYAFINCTACGPRYTLTRCLPYDRSRTSMATFPMCPDCAREYADPTNRRFHAEPTACPVCGPQLSHDPADILQQLLDGRIVALKGIGGFHLACDARNQVAVARLRQRKQRDAKPFAVMVAGLAAAHQWAHLDAAEAALLADRHRPIVVLPQRLDADLAPGVSEDLGTVGLLLPYTPLHHLLFHEAAGRPCGTDWLDAPHTLALVMTSANPGGEPLVIDDAEAQWRLADIADSVVGHDRAILTRCDDSVMRVIAGAPAILRHARGHAPRAIALPHAVPPILAVGGQKKVTVCLTRGTEAFLSQHIGDVNDRATYGFLKETVAHLTGLLAVAPVAVAHDRHPDFMTTRFARETKLPCVAVQHHQAHLAALAAESGIMTPLTGLVLDGYGLGADGRSAWGGELLRLDGTDCRRLGHLAPLAQPGGDRAAREPWRMAAAALHALGRGDSLGQRFADRPDAGRVAQMLSLGINAPPTTSCGRLFDAAAGLLGVRPVTSFEGEAAMALEGLVDTPTVLAGGWHLDDGVLDLRPLLAALDGMNPRSGANLFHGTLAAALADWAGPIVRSNGETELALSGGCASNRVLVETLAESLAGYGLRLLVPRKAPTNDGGLSLGQAWVAAQKVATGSTNTPPVDPITLTIEE